MNLDPSAELTAAINRLAAALERQNAGSCPSYLETEFLGTTDRYFCRHPAGHTGLHANDPATNDHESEIRWTDNSPGASTITDPTCAAVRDAARWAERGSADQYGAVTDWPCVLPPGHTGHTDQHQDRDGDGWWSA